MRDSKHVYYNNANINRRYWYKRFNINRFIFVLEHKQRGCSGLFNINFINECVYSLCRLNMLV